MVLFLSKRAAFIAGRTRFAKIFSMASGVVAAEP